MTKTHTHKYIKGVFGYCLLLKTENWKYCNKIIFKWVNSTMGSIFNESFVEKRGLWVPWTVHGTTDKHWTQLKNHFNCIQTFTKFYNFFHILNHYIIVSPSMLQATFLSNFSSIKNLSFWIFFKGRQIIKILFIFQIKAVLWPPYLQHGATLTSKFQIHFSCIQTFTKFYNFFHILNYCIIVSSSMLQAMFLSNFSSIKNLLDFFFLRA